jgi:hypothetical protein
MLTNAWHMLTNAW